MRRREQRASELARRAQEVAREKADRLEAAFQIGAGIKAVCIKVVNHVVQVSPAERVFLTDAYAELESLKVALDKYDPADFPTHRELMPLVSVRSVCAALSWQLEHSVRRADSSIVNSEVRNGFQGLVETLDHHVDLLRKVSDDARAIAKL